MTFYDMDDRIIDEKFVDGNISYAEAIQIDVYGAVKFKIENEGINTLFVEIMPDVFNSTKHFHNPVIDSEISATCDTDGKTQGSHCLECKEIIVPQNIIPATGHSFKEYVSNKDATCTLDGTKTAICENGCGTTDTIQDIGSATGHRIEVTTIESTCTEQGKQTTTCMQCDYIEEKDLEILSHEYSTIYTIDKKATLYSTGSMSRHCKNAKCTSKKDSKSIAKISSVKLLSTSYIYSGKIITPTVIVKNAVGTMLKKDVDYTVKYASGRKNPGQYNVIVSFTGQYSGTKSLTFKVSPKVPTNVKATQTTHEITLRWSKSVGATGYEIYQYNTNNKRYTKVGSTTETKIAIKGRKSGTKYNYVIRAYKKVGSNNIKSAYSTMIKTTTKPGTPKIKVTAGTKSATISWNKVSGASGYVVYMSTKKNGGYKRIATLGSETLKYKKLYLTKGKIYYFKVKAFTKNSTEIYGAESLVKLARIK